MPTNRFAAPRRWLAHLLPSSCALCGANGNDALCNGCHDQYFAQLRHRCDQCAAILADSTTRICGTCLKHPPAFDATVVAADYAPPIDQLVLSLKFGSRLALAPLFAQLLRDALVRQQSTLGELPTLLAPVPLGLQRLQERGFNQALEIARPLSQSLGITLAPRLAVRLRETRAQSQLHGDERHANMRRAFGLPENSLAQVRGQHVGIVDDVITTGETLQELAATLKRFGAARVTNLVFARTLPK